ncbi:MAG: DNA primase [Saprospiraceae bacterium]|nr:DNA primase [Saprospiraceae bacterium]
MIQHNSIQKVIDAARIEEIVRDYVDLKNRGSNLTGLCPFHKEKTPSFSVSPSKNIFKCFGCGKGGDPIEFIKEIEQLSFSEAIRLLAKRYQIELEEKELSQQDQAAELEIQSLNIINQWAQEYYSDKLWNSDEGKNIGLSYFKERGFLDSTLQKFGIGFAADYPSAFTQESIQKGYQAEFLKKVGLTTANHQDFFRNRIIFPLHNQSGKVTGFAGRIIGGESKIAKYINSPESQVYKKSKTLFGLHLAKNEIRKQNNCYLVEGYTDVMSLHQAGIENVVASSGTALTEDQIHLIKRHAQTVTILYDGDQAGIKAAERGIELIIKEGLNVYVALFPEKEDPDSFVKKYGYEGFQNFLTNEVKDFILFKIQLLHQQSQNDPVKRSAVVQEIVQIIAKIEDSIKRSIYLQNAAKILQLQESTLIENCNNYIRENLKNKSFADKRKSLQHDETILNDQQEISFKKQNQHLLETGDEIHEKELIRILMLAADQPWKDTSFTVAHFIIENIIDILEYFDNPFYAMLIQDVIGRIQTNDPVNFNYFLHHPTKHVSQLAIEFSAFPYSYSDNWADKYGIYLNKKTNGIDYTENEIESVVKYLKFRKFNKVIKELDQQIVENTAHDEGVELIKAREEIKKMKNQLFQEVWKTEN